MGDTEEQQRRDGDYRSARIGAATALVAAIVFMFVVDTLDREYHPDPIIITTLLGTILTLLGIEIGSALIRKRD